VKPYGDRLREIRLADNDRDLVTEALAAAKHHELGASGALKRHVRSADD
jgi:hypothetical protein